MNNFFKGQIDTQEKLLNVLTTTAIMSVAFAIFVLLDGIEEWQADGGFSVAGFIIAPLVMINSAGIAWTAATERRKLKRGKA